MSITDLTDLFAKLGARNPAGWAHSQVAEGIPQLAKFLFLRQAWRCIVAENDRHWIGEQREADPKVPGSSIASALDRVLSRGVDEKDLTTVVRVMQWQLLFALCCILDDPGKLEDDVKNVAWRLFQVDENGNPITAIAGLHESVLETEPSGREMRSA